MDEVVIAGVGMHKFGRFPDKDINDIGLEAVMKALKDANMPYTNVEFAVCGTVFGNQETGIKVLTKLGFTGIPIYDIDAACATGGASLRIAYQAIAGGFCDVVLAFGVDKHAGGMFEELGEDWQNRMGMQTGPMWFATEGQRYMHEHGATEEDYAKVAVKAHKCGHLNPNALFQMEFTVEQVLNSPMVAYPLHLYNFCSPDDGAAAVVLCSRKMASKYASKPVILAATVMQTGEYPPSIIDSPNYSSTTEREPKYVTELAAKKAYEMAGIGPEDVDVAEVQDTASPQELIHMEQLGVCKPGDAVRLLRKGETEIGGKTPINPSGGLQCKGEPVGASGLGQVCEIVWQLRGQAGLRQVDHPKVGLCHVVGAHHISAVTILKS